MKPNSNSFDFSYNLEINFQNDFEYVILLPKSIIKGGTSMYIRREFLDRIISFKDTDFIKVITGVRRSGKSVLLKQYEEYLYEEGIEKTRVIHINLEAFEYQNVTTSEEFSKLLSDILPEDSGRIYILIDEIQFVEDWQKVINSLRVSFDCDIVITGSNAKLLSGELATLLSGRYVVIPIYPFSFKEFLLVKNIDKDSRQVDIAYREYEKYGGFPSVVLSEETLKKTILSGIYDSIILNDIAIRGGVKETFALKRVVSFLADNVGQLINPSKISNILKQEKLNISNHTVNKYLELLQGAYLFYEAKPYDIRGKAYLKQNSKYFMVDNGLRNHAVSHKNDNLGNRLENIVYLELVRRGYSVDVVRLDSKEVDFLARKDNIIEYYQVAYQLPTDSHETDNLLMIKDNYKKVVITGRYEDVDFIDGIEIKYIVDWLVE